MAGEVFEQTSTLAVLVRRRFLEDVRAEVSRSREGRVDVWYSNLDEMGHSACARRDLVGVTVRDDDGAVRSDTQLSAVRITDAYALAEAERGLSHLTAALTSR
jgi:hypothetical protein